MRIKNNKLKLLSIILILLLCPLFVNIKSTFGIYKTTLHTSVSLTILDPATNHEVTLALNDGSGDTTTVYKSHNETMGADLITPTRTNYNFMGWYDSNNRRIYADEAITGDVTFHAEWSKIVCKKVATVNDLNTETCAGTAGCATTGTGYSTSSGSNTITYGAIFGEGSPKAGDAYDCDVYYSSNEDTFDETDGNGKHIERFYFVREKENNGSENTAVLIYYTIFDSTGRVDTQHTDKDHIGSSYYTIAEGWLPTSTTVTPATAAWTNPKLIDFDPNNGKVTRFLSLDDLEAVCGPVNSDGTASTSYFTSCFADSHNWFLFENSRFQSSIKGRAGIWLETDGTRYYRIQTSTIAINTNAGNDSENAAKPVIEIPMSSLDGFINANRYTISFETYGGDELASQRRYDGEAIGTIPTVTREHYTFDGWYSTYSNGEYSNPVSASTIVHGNMTLHAKWIAKPTCTITLVLNGGSGVSSPIIVDIGDVLDPVPQPTKPNSSFVGWYTDEQLETAFNANNPINVASMTLYAKWTSANYVAEVEGVGSFETLADAISHVPTGTTVKTRITLLQDITLDTPVTIPNDKWIELDGGSYTISTTSDCLSGNTTSLITNNGKLDIISGTITTSNYTTTTTLITNVSGATLKVSGGSLINPSVVNGTTEFIVIANKGTVNITGGHFESYGQSAGFNNNAGISNISGGEFYAHNTTKGQALYMDGGTVNISGGYFENVSRSSGDGARGAVDNNGGTLNITGGTIVSQNYAAVVSRKNGGKVNIGVDDSDINITSPVMRGNTYGLLRTNGTVKIYDGLFESYTNTRAISGTISDQPDGVDFTDSTIDVNGVTYHTTYLLLPSFTVTFYPENGDATITKTIDNGNAIGTDMPSDPTKTNYYFDGWYDGTTQITSATVPTSNISAYARWVQSVSNATINSSLSVPVSSSEVILITGTDIESCTFASSDTNIATVDANGEVTGVNVGTATITITGTKSGDTRTVSVTVNNQPATRTVRFYDSDGVTEYQDKLRTVANGGSLGENMPSDPTKTNYIFDGWYIKNTSNQFTSATTITGNVDVVARWKETVTVATIPASPLNIMLGGSYVFSIPATSGDTVEDFILSTSDSNIVDINNKTLYGVVMGSVTLTITGSESHATRTLTVNVINTYAVKFVNDNGTVLGTIDVVNGSTIDDTTGATLPNNPTKSGYTFDDWYIFDGTDVTTTRLDTSATVTSAIVYKPRWAGSNDVAAIGTTYYTNIALAINDAPDDIETEIRILKDISNLTCTAGITSCSTAGRTTIPSGKIIAISGGTHTVSCGNSTASNVLYNNGGVLKIKSGTFTCATKSGLATIENTPGAVTYIEGGTISNTKDRAAIYNKGTVYVSGGSLFTGENVKIRAVIQNDAVGAAVIMSGGTVTQQATETTDAKANGAIRIISGSSATITGGTIISNSSNTPAVYNAGTLVVGHDDDDNAYDTTTPVIQGENYGINSTVNYSVYDGIIKGKQSNKAVNDTSKITGFETDLTLTTGTDGDYYTLYFASSTPPALTYRISFNAINEELNPNSFDIDQGTSIETLPTGLTWGSKTFGGWYTDTTYTTAVSNSTVPTGNATYYAKWTYTPASQLVTFDSTNDAMSTYFSNISTWKNMTESDFATAMGNDFSTNNCSECTSENSCNSRTSGTSCDLPKAYNTNANGAVSVYLYDNTNHVVKTEVKYANSSSGTITNLIPGQVYYWEKDSDPTVNGLIQVTTPRRTLNVGNVRNVRDLGGLTATYTENNVQHTGTLKYGKLFRGAKLTASQDDVTNLTNLGVTREIDLRADSEGAGQARLPVLDNGSGGSDIVITNYLINPVDVTYSWTHTPQTGDPSSGTTVTAHASNSQALKSAIKATMQYIVAGDSIYFHCTIGTDRTGTLAYFLEGLLGVSEEDRLQDYDLTYFYGLTNRTRYHDDLYNTSIYPRFKFMHTAYPTNQDIYNWYVNYNQESDDLTLLSAFRQAMIE